MNIEGLDYNTQREKLILPEYGREIQKMVDHAVGLPSKEERQRCAETIVAIMDRMYAQNRENSDYKHKLWDHLALMSNFKLDIDYPYDVTQALKLASKPDVVPYPARKIPIRHYGKMMFEMFEKLKGMEPGPARDYLVGITANQMKRLLIQWGHGLCSDEKVAADLKKYTDGKICLDLDKFKFDKINEREVADNRRKKR